MDGLKAAVRANITFTFDTRSNDKDRVGVDVVSDPRQYVGI